MTEPSPHRPHPARLIPARWRGASRRAAFLRRRARKITAAVLAATAVMLTVHAVAPADGATRSVTVAGRDLPAGHRVAASDLRQISWPETARLPGRLSAHAAVGRVTTSAVRAGEPITAGRVRPARSWPGAESGQVLMSVPIPDDALAGLLRTGDRLDVLSAGDGDRLADDVLVVALYRPPSDANPLHTRSPGTGASAVIACDPDTAGRISAELAGKGLGTSTLVTVLHPAA